MKDQVCTVYKHKVKVDRKVSPRLAITNLSQLPRTCFAVLVINIFVSISDLSLRPSLTYQYQVFVNTAQAISVRIQYSNTGGCKPDGITALLCSHTKWSQLPTHSSMFVFILLKLKSKVISFQLRNMNNRLSGRFLYFISPLMVTHVKGNEWRRVVSRGE